MLDLPSLPRGITLCNVFGHEPAIAEYVMMMTLALTLRLFESVQDFRAGSWPRTSRPGARRTARFSARRSASSVMAGSAARSPGAPAAFRVQGDRRQPQSDRRPGRRIRDYPLGELDRMLPQCDVVLIAAGLAPETRGLVAARRLGLMKPTALLIISVGRRSSTRRRFTAHCATSASAAPDSMSGGSIGAPSIPTAGRRSFRSTNCPTC